MSARERNKDRQAVLKHLQWDAEPKRTSPAKQSLRNLHLAFEGLAEHFEYVKSLLSQLGPTS